MIKLKDILLEDSDFGKIVFGDEDAFAKLQGSEAGDEPDTESENDLWNTLESWITYGGVDRKRELEARIDDLRDLAKKYPKFFKPSTSIGTIMYRGLVDIGKILKSVSVEDYDDWVLTSDWYVVLTKPYKYTSSSSIQSWTNKISIAKKSLVGMFPSSTAVVVTKQDSNFVMNAKTMHIISKAANNSEYPNKVDEGEIFHLGNSYQNNIFVAFKLDDLQTGSYISSIVPPGLELDWITKLRQNKVGKLTDFVKTLKF